MILARLSQAIRTQNWFAVALEFVIVILGVVIGFQITEWNGERQERRLTTVTLERLENDFIAIVNEEEGYVASISTTIETMSVMRTALRDGSLPAEASGTFESGLLRAYTHREPAGRSSTFVEIEASGRMALIEDENLRQALLHYDAHVAAARENFLHARLIQTEYMRPFTRQYDTAPGAERRTVTTYDFDAMADDRDFVDAVEQLAAMQHVYLTWHQEHLDRARMVLVLIRQSHSEARE